MYSVEVSALSKNIGAQQILKNIHFALKAGEILTLLGPNGAGKTTLLSCLTGLRRPQSGHVKINGYDPTTVKGKSYFASSPQDCEFPLNMRVSEILEFVLSHYEQPHSIDELRERFDLKNIFSQKAGGLSGGQKRRLSLACVFGSRAPILFLDEPSAGLDLDLRQKLINEIKMSKRNQQTVILTTHYLEEAEEVSEKVGILFSGELKYFGALDELKGKIAQKKIRYKDANGKWQQMISHNSDRDVVALCRESTFTDLEVIPVNLEDAFSQFLEDQKAR